MNLIKILLITVAIGSQAQAAKIAIIDSGTDLSHTELKNKKWFNAKDIDDAVDNDDNGLIDDVNGWNFAENNNKLYDKSLVGTFSADVYKFFEIQTRMMRGTATQADLEWMQNARSNRELLSELQVFGNFVHGTHVAGIAAKNADQAEIMALKIIPTKPPINPRVAQFARIVKSHESFMAGNEDALIKMALKALAAQQAKSLAPIGEYVGKQKMRIANCSFGTSTKAVKAMIMPQLLKLVLRREPTEEELTTYSIFFVNEVVNAAKVLVTPAPNTLFVIAAGNDGSNNDELPTSPANLRLQNTITVAATLDYTKLASFSNFGSKMVDVAAPGVGIESAIPGQQTLTVSGTSQASPFVANVAGMLVDANSNLSNGDLKKILMETSDLKEFLSGKVASGGIVNINRAVTAAKLALTMQLNDALNAARVQVNDVKTPFTLERTREEGIVLPMPTLF